MQQLKERGWITIEPIHREMKGRPVLNYRLAVPFDRIIRTIIKENQQKIRKIKNKIKALKDLTK
jgi:predicted transcriptional regulator